MPPQTTTEFVLAVPLWGLLTFLAGLLVAFLGAVLTAVKLIMRQMELRLKEQFTNAKETTQQSQSRLFERLEKLECSIASEAKTMTKIERDLLLLKADLPLQYIRRDDYVRNQSVIEAKLDGLALKLENTQLRGTHHG